MNGAFYVILGIVFLTGVNFLVTLAFVSFYNYVAKVKTSLKDLLLLATSLSLLNALIQFLMMVIFLQAGVIIYPLFVFVFSAAGYFLLMHFVYKIHYFENIIITLSLSVILNPIWLILFGILK